MLIAQPVLLMILVTFIVSDFNLNLAAQSSLQRGQHSTRTNEAKLNKVRGRSRKKIYKRALKSLNSSTIPKKNAYNLAKLNRNLNGQQLRVGAAEAAPYSYLIKGDIVGVDREVLEILSETLNFTYIFHVLPEKKWGGRVNGTWYGLVAEVLYGDVDLAISSVAVLLDRYKVVDYAVPLNFQGMGFLIEKPRAIGNGWARVWHSFPGLLWIMVVCTLILCSLFLSYLSRPRFTLSIATASGLKIYYLKWASRVGSAFFFHTSLICSQHPFTVPKMYPIRSFVGCVMVSFLFLQYAFTCFLTSKFTRTSYESLANTFEEMLNRGYTPVKPLDNAQYDQIIEKEESLMAKQLKKRIQRLQRNLVYQSLLNWRDFDKDVLAGRKAYLDTEGRLRLFQSLHKDQDFRMSKEGIFNSFTTWIFPKDSPLKEYLNWGLSRLIESGIYEKVKSEADYRLVKRLSGKTDFELKAVEDEFSYNSLSISHLQSAFYILAFGYVAASVVLFMETLWKRRHLRKHLLYETT